MDGGVTSKNGGDRAGIHCKTVKDATLVLDAIKGYQTDDTFTAIPKALIPKEPFVSFLVPDSAVKAKPLKGMRIGVVREFMVKHTKNDVAISDQIDNEIKTVLRDKLGAEIVESYDPLYPDDPTVPNMKYTFQDAIAEILPHNAPEYFWRTIDSARRGAKLAGSVSSDELMYAVPGWDVRTAAYDVALAMHKAPLSDKINLRSISQQPMANPATLLSVNQYLAERGDARVKDWASYVANSVFKTDEERAQGQNAIDNPDPRPRQDVVSYLKMQAIMRMIVLKVMYENKIDVFVNPEQTTPQYILGGPPEPDVNERQSHSCCAAFTALLGAPEADVPAGFNAIVYNPTYALSADKTEYISVTGTVESKMAHPMPISLMVWSGPGSDSDVIKVASAYESATHHRTPPPAFGPVLTGAKTETFSTHDKAVAGGTR
jgi:Asp-tRNA(Asn)/Glu-tRNA(Gln) amidotransferase A subunit family amidase